MKFFPIASRELFTVTVTEHGLDTTDVVGVKLRLNGAFVRLGASPDVTDAKVEEARQWLLEHGALRVHVLPRRRAGVVLEKMYPSPSGPQPAVTVRDTVMSMGQKANSKDRAALLAVLEESLSAAGL